MNTESVLPSRSSDLRVSALVITYNRREHICRAIDSILGQTHPVDEIVVVDDGSTDGTSELLRQKYTDSIRVVQQENMGISMARRRAVLEASGTWVAFLDSDDEWTLDRNAEFQKIIVGIPGDVAWVFGDTAVVRDEGIVGTIFKRYASHMDLSPRVLEDSMRVQLPFQLGLIQSSLYRRSALLEVDCFSEGLAHSEDFLVGVQVAARRRVALIPEVVTRLFRTSELKGGSQDLLKRGGQDYIRARMIAARTAIEAGHRQPWADLYMENARALCRAQALSGAPNLELAREQFRYGRSAKSCLFYLAALCGKPGLKAWDLLVQANSARKTPSKGNQGEEDVPLL